VIPPLLVLADDLGRDAPPHALGRFDKVLAPNLHEGELVVSESARAREEREEEGGRTLGVFMSSFIAVSAASWQIEAHSAPEQPSVCTRKRKRVSACRQGR